MSGEGGAYPFATPRQSAFAYGPGEKPASYGQRQAWAELIRQARAAAAEAMARDGAADRAAAPRLVAAWKAAQRAAFPNPHAVAQAAAAGLIAWLRAWNAAARPADRLTLARAMGPMAEAMDAYLAEEAEAQAALARRRLPQGDRD